MNLSDMRFPRRLEAVYTPDAIRLALMKRRSRLWSGSEIEVPSIALTDRVKKALRLHVLKSQILCGFENASERLKNEMAGIRNLRDRTAELHGERVSRLILLSDDGAERLYRHVEHLLRAHWPRVLVCLSDADSRLIGEVVTGKDRQIKLIMAEHKDAVSEILRAIVESGEGR